MTFFEELKWRGVVKDISSPELENKLNNESLTFYLGTDPTADSLHIGHYASFVTAKRLARHGHKPIILVGGATGLIGDPRPTAEREIISKETVAKNIEGLKKQRDSLLRSCIYCDKCNRYYDKTSNCISSGIETRKIIRYNGDLEKGDTEMKIPVLFHICPLGHKMGESGL